MFLIVHNYFPLELGKRPNPDHSRMLCAKFGRNWPCRSWEEDFKFRQCILFLLFHYYLPLEKSVALHTWILVSLNPLHPRMLDWNWLSVSWEDFKISSMYLCYFVIISLEKGRDPSFELNWILFTQGCFVPFLVEIGFLVERGSGEEDENVKNLRQRRRRKTVVQVS